jgi:hypothetical protein
VSSSSQPFSRSRDLSLLRLVVAWRSSPAVVQARQVNVTTEVQADLVAAARGSLAAIETGRAVPYTADAVFTPTEWARVGAKHVDPDSAVMKALAPLNYRLASTDDLARQFLFFAYVAGPVGKEIVFVSKFNPNRGLRRKRVFRFLDDQLTEIEEPVLAFNPSEVDLVFVPGGEMAALDVGVFEFLLRDAPEIMAKTPKKVAALAATVPLAAGSDTVLTEVALRDSRARRRLLAIVERNHMKGVEIAAIRKALSDHGYKPAAFIQGGKVVVTNENAMTVLQILNEDVITGAFSKTRFAADRKAPA